MTGNFYLRTSRENGTHAYTHSELEQCNKAFVVARALGRCLVTLVNPSGNDVNHTNKLNHTSSNESLGLGNTKHKEQRGENTLILMEWWYLVTEGESARLHKIQRILKKWMHLLIK